MAGQWLLSEAGSSLNLAALIDADSLCLGQALERRSPWPLRVHCRPQVPGTFRLRMPAFCSAQQRSHQTSSSSMRLH